MGIVINCYYNNKLQQQALFLKIIIMSLSKTDKSVKR